MSQIMTLTCCVTKHKRVPIHFRNSLVYFGLESFLKKLKGVHTINMTFSIIV
ncbi:hypothetical protein Lalb_Chr12g0197471 [Lupinus albus]|uniref:Uncharacterized protein n=1 Tax=Lupinus albus TaxID=3870 RepID=A0A6A4PL82_LUPAL|nr:hypothetical protein Lalb_Chr12g0197471 [Lupinus albus]